MSKKICLWLLFVVIAFPTMYASGQRSHSLHPSSSGTKSVHVRGYTKKDGTYVAPYDRTAPGEGSRSTNISSSPTGVKRTPVVTHVRYHAGYMATGVAAHSSVARDSRGRIKRSKAAINAFKRQQPCPATGSSSGRCPGYVIDHVNPLECGGADAPSNMQWQTVAEGKAKDKTERSCAITR